MCGKAREISGATSAVVLYSDGGVLSRFINTDQLFSSCKAGCGDANRGLLCARVRSRVAYNDFCVPVGNLGVVVEACLANSFLASL